MRNPFSRQAHPPSDHGSSPLTAALDAIYQTVLAPAVWSPALAAVASFLEADAAMLAFGDDGPSSASIVASCGLPDALLAGYRGPEIAADPLVVAALAAPDHMLLSTRAKVAGSRLGRGLLAPAELKHAAGSLLVGGASSFAFAWFFRTSQRAAFGTPDATRAETLVPHLRRAVAAQIRLQRTEYSLELLTAAFDHIALGAVIVDPEGRPLLVNKVAGRIAAANDGFGLTAEGLRCVTAADSRRLRELIRAVAMEGERTGSIGVRMPRRAEGRPFELILVPLVGESPNGGAAAVVFVSDPERFHLTPEALLRDLYGMTTAEARLALRLADGETLTEAADHLGIARNTAHCQLDSIFVKTDSHSQAELVRLLHRGPVATRPYEDSARHEPVTPE